LYKHADEEQKQQVDQYINAWLKYFVEARSPNGQLFDIMKQSAVLAQRNELKPEMLGDLLTPDKS
jgi:hypothetical protein